MSEHEWRPALSMRWKHLLFVHWRVPVASLRPLIPEPLQIDTYDGAAWVGFVPFVMESVRPVWLPPIPKLFDFPEANVRTYVRYGEQLRGVVFSALTRRIGWACVVARRFWKLPYLLCPYVVGDARAPNEIAYSMTRKARPRPYARVRYRYSGEPRETEPNTLEHFLVERYTLFTAHRGELYRGEVAHLPYAIQPATLLELEQTLTDAAGISVAARPDSVFYAPWFWRAGVRAAAAAHRQRYRARAG
jgi:uncharacterized protein YqjF (DUF2071 family)